MKNEKKIFGYELLVDCYNCKEGVCSDLDHCYSFLDKLVDFIGMEKQAPPQIFRTDRKKYPDKTGLTGWVPLVESSIVIHTLTKKDFISVDVYSCGEFDPNLVVKFIKKYFKTKKIEKKLVERGKNYY